MGLWGNGGVSLVRLKTKLVQAVCLSTYSLRY